jgi:hypothetical protein
MLVFWGGGGGGGQSADPLGPLCGDTSTVSYHVACSWVVVCKSILIASVSFLFFLTYVRLKSKSKPAAAADRRLQVKIVNRSMHSWTKKIQSRFNRSIGLSSLFYSIFFLVYFHLEEAKSICFTLRKVKT